MTLIRIQLILSSLILFLLLTTPLLTLGQSAEEIRQQINQHSAQIEALNKEIAAYEKELQAVGAKKQTLQSTLTQLDLSRKKITASINVTKNKIGTLQLEIQNLGSDITTTEGAIELNEEGLAESIRHLHEVDKQSPVLSMLSSVSLASIWSDLDQTARLQDAMQDDIANLSEQKRTLTETKTATEDKQAELLVQQKNLVAQQGSLDASRRAQSELLAQTKSQESTYQAIVSEKQAAKAAFEKSLEDLESKLEFTLDPSKLPTAGKGIIRWPLDNVRITQQFGKTADSGRLYASGSHNGIDLAASIGTPVKAALSGTVIGTGDTDGGGCYSYGRWVLIRHGNGLTTLYAHLSQINVSTGEGVSTRQLIGYSGFTGYATGPHLHFTVFASEGVSVKNLGTWYRENGQAATTACAKKGAIIPVAAQSAYLNPMDYL